MSFSLSFPPSSLQLPIAKGKKGKAYTDTVGSTILANLFGTIASLELPITSFFFSASPSFYPSFSSHVNFDNKVKLKLDTASVVGLDSFYGSSLSRKQVEAQATQ